MNKRERLIEQAKEVLRIEASAIGELIEKIGESFSEAVQLIYHCKSKIVITGIGKSGIIGQKIAATLASTGTPALFLHPTEAIHGDIGMVVEKDIIIAISNSGETPEIIQLLPHIKRCGAKIIALTGNIHSTLARCVDIVLDVGVNEEACPMNLIPTASTTTALALGDALAVCLIKKRNFGVEDFALLHPGGRLGKRLLLKVEDLMHTGTEIPKVSPDTQIFSALFEISSKQLGITTVVDEDDKLLGIITDGDLRRIMEKYSYHDIWSLPVREVMNHTPKTIERTNLASQAINAMETYAITSLLVVDDSKKLIGVIHMHDLLK